MSGVKENGTVITNHTPKEETIIAINRLANAPRLRGHNSWAAYDTIYWSKYQIKETDMRVKTATFTSEMYLDLTTGVYCVLITSPFHEDFGGVILSVEKDTETGLYNYQCQDFTRFYQDKWEVVNSGKASLHRLIKNIITAGGVPITGDIGDTEKNYSTILAGLRPAYQYDQEYWNPDIKNFNPMTTSYNGVIKGKSSIEIIRDYVFGTGAYIDVYADKYGVIQIEPYHRDEWLTSCVDIPFDSIMDIKVKFDTTNIVTSIGINSNEQLKVNNDFFTSESLIGLNLTSFFGFLTETVNDPNQETVSSTTSKTTSKSTSTSKKSTSTKTAKKNSNNPYKTKKKNIYINTDRISSKASDKQFMKDIAKLLKKQGWNPVIIGRGPNTHTENYMKNHKNGVWFCIYGGADSGVFKECIGKNSYTNKLKKNNLRTVIGMRTGVVSGKPCDIRKGGKCYKYLGRAWDDNYSSSSHKGMSYPLSQLTKGKVPIMYASTAEKMVAKFLKGGDNPSAC